MGPQRRQRHTAPPQAREGGRPCQLVPRRPTMCTRVPAQATGAPSDRWVPEDAALHDPAEGRLASHSSTTQQGQPMEFAPNCSAWGNVPSARHRHSVRRLTPTRSNTSGTRNMASPETLGAISAPPTVHTDPTSIPTNPALRLAGPARHATGSGVQADQQAAATGAAGGGQHNSRRGDPGGARAVRGAAQHRRGGNRAVGSGGHGPKLRSRHERSRTLANAPRPASVPDTADTGATAAVARFVPTSNASPQPGERPEQSLDAADDTGPAAREDPPGRQPGSPTCRAGVTEKLRSRRGGLSAGASAGWWASGVR